MKPFWPAPFCRWSTIPKRTIVAAEGAVVVQVAVVPVAVLVAVVAGVEGTKGL